MAQLAAVYMLGLILRSIGIALIAGICCWKIRNAAVRHAVWVAVLVAMLLLPVCDYFLPESWVPARIQQFTSEQSIPFQIVSVRSPGISVTHTPSPLPSGASSSPDSGLDWWIIGLTAYVLVTVAMFVRIFLGYRKIRLLLRCSQATDSRVWDEILAAQALHFRIPTLRESEIVQVPMTIGFLRPAVILPADWSAWDDWKIRAVLLHEIAHVRRSDWGIAVLAAASRCAFWLNPVPWFLERQLSQLAEESSDDASLAGTKNATRYAEILLEFAAAAQNGRRLMRGGVAMAQHRMKARIERVLGNPVSGTGIVKKTSWMLVLILAAPVIYCAAALQVASNPAPEPTPPPQIVPEAARPTGVLGKLIEASVQSRNPQQRNAEAEPKLYTRMEEAVVQAGPAQEPSSTTDKTRTLDFQMVEQYNAQRQLNAALTALQQQNPTISPSQPATLQVQPEDEADLRAYLQRLAQLRVNQTDNSFSIFVVRNQGRTMNIKVAGQVYSLGCDNCSFFVGESAISSASPEPTVPGITVRLSPDGSDLFINCHAAGCNVVEDEILGDGTEQLSNFRKLESGVSAPFRTTKPLRVIVSKN